MKTLLMLIALSVLILASCKEKNLNHNMGNVKTDSLTFISGYSDVNGLKMYYEIYGEGKPLVLIHGGGSTIQTTFGNVIPLLARTRKLIAVELQAHGRTGDRSTELSFEQDADDVATLLKNLNISRVDILGFSNGGTTALYIAMRHPELVDKIVAASALCKRNGVPTQFWDFMKQAQLENMPQPLKDGYLKVAADTGGLKTMHDKDAKRMLNFKDIPDEEISSVKAPVFIVVGDKDVILPEHALEMHRLLKNSELAIIPGVHGEYLGEVTTLDPGNNQPDLVVVPMIEKFLDKTK